MNNTDKPRGITVINYFMSKLNSYSVKWCESGSGCACNGCANSVVSHDEWLLWKDSVNYCDCCGRSGK